MSYQQGGREHMQRAGTQSASSPRTPSTITTDPATQTSDQTPDHATTAEPERPTKQCAHSTRARGGKGARPNEGPHQARTQVWTPSPAQRHWWGRQPPPERANAASRLRTAAFLLQHHTHCAYQHGAATRSVGQHVPGGIGAVGR
jgi:hypothetical protein